MPESPSFRYNGKVKYISHLLLLIWMFFSGCLPQTGNAVITPSVLTPYATRTASIPTIPAAPPTLEPPPASELPTQITHVVKKGEDMGGIATQYVVKIKDLKAANAEINPRMIPVGTILIIPSGDPQQDTYRPTAISTPAVILQSGAPVCYADPSGGCWCLMKVENTSGAPVEDISADFSLSGSGDSETQTRTAFGMLDRLPDGAAIPLAVYFPEAPPQPWQINTRLRTASAVIKENERYLQSQPDNTVTAIAADKFSARVSGIVNLLENQPDARVILVSAAAYNAAGQPVGARRWESPVGLESGSGLMYDFYVYSLNGPIDRVEILAETRPK